MSIVSARGYVIAAAAVVAVLIGGGVWVVLGRAGSEPPAAPTMTARVDQFRAEEPLRLLRLTFGNREPEPVFVETVQVVSPDFEMLPPRRQDYALPPGGTVEVGLRTIQTRAVPRRDPDNRPPGRCDRADPHPGRVIGRVQLPARRQARPAGQAAIDCETEKIESTVQLTYGNTWEITTTDAGESAVRTVRSARLTDPDATVEVIRLRGSVLFDISAATEPIARLCRNEQIPVSGRE